MFTDRAQLDLVVHGSLPTLASVHHLEVSFGCTFRLDARAFGIGSSASDPFEACPNVRKLKLCLGDSLWILPNLRPVTLGSLRSLDVAVLGMLTQGSISAVVSLFTRDTLLHSQHFKTYCSDLKHAMHLLRESGTVHHEALGKFKPLSLSTSVNSAAEAY